jgi:hypothetical protein
MTERLARPLKMTPGWQPDLPPFAMLGTRNETGEHSITVPYGHTTCWARPSRTLTNDEIELWQLGQFTSDLYTGTGERIVPDGVEKHERPDFVIRQGDGTALGVELAAFTPAARRAHEHRVGQFRAEMATSAPHYDHLAGCHLSLSIDTTGPRRKLARIRDEVLGKLRHAPRPPSLGPYGAPGPTVLGRGDGWDITGYELMAPGLLETADERLPIIDTVFALEQTLEEVTRQLWQLIDGHRYEGVDYWLVIPIVGPDQNGVGFWEDEALIEFVLEHDAFAVEQARIEAKRILLHFWTTGAVREILPNTTELCPPRADHQRRMTILTYQNDALFCAPLSQPAIRCSNCAN